MSRSPGFVIIALSLMLFCLTFFNIRLCIRVYDTVQLVLNWENSLWQLHTVHCVYRYWLCQEPLMSDDSRHHMPYKYYLSSFLLVLELQLKLQRKSNMDCCQRTTGNLAQANTEWVESVQFNVPFDTYIVCIKCLCQAICKQPAALVLTTEHSKWETIYKNTESNHNSDWS